MRQSEMFGIAQDSGYDSTGVHRTPFYDNSGWVLVMPPPPTTVIYAGIFMPFPAFDGTGQPIHGRPVELRETIVTQNPIVARCDGISYAPVMLTRRATLHEDVPAWVFTHAAKFSALERNTGDLQEAA